MRRARVLPLIPLALFAACGDDEETRSATASSGGGEVSAPATIEASGEEITRAPVDPTAPVPVVVRGTNDVAFALLGASYAGEDVVVSPASVSTAFAMAAAGADEPTRAQLDAVFGYPPGEGLPAAMNTLSAQLTPDRVPDGTGETPVFELASTAYAQDDAEIAADFERVLAEFYGAGVDTVDFTDAEAARGVINGWVAERTRDRIPELIAAPGLPVETQLALANAAYFRAQWLIPFDEAVTVPLPFTTAAGAVVQAPTMHAERDLAFVLDEDVVAVHLPYVGGEFAMTIAMPDDVAQFLATADFDAWAQLSGAATMSPVVLDLPRWEAATTADLGPTLSGLGLPIPGGSYPGIVEGMRVDAVVHGANVTVDERGTEAAAATVIAMADSAPAPPADPVEIRIDRPFVYSITHVPSGLILFAGIETDPTT